MCGLYVSVYVCYLRWESGARRREINEGRGQVKKKKKNLSPYPIFDDAQMR